MHTHTHTSFFHQCQIFTYWLWYLLSCLILTHDNLISFQIRVYECIWITVLLFWIHLTLSVCDKDIKSASEDFPLWQEISLV